MTGRETVLRTAYHTKLEELRGDLVRMCDMVAGAMGQATTALLEADRELAEVVIGGDTEIDLLTEAIEGHCTELLALQAPVGHDLRAVVGALRISASLERMGDLAEHVAKQARLRSPRHVVPQELTPVFADMGRMGESIARKAGEVIDSQDLSKGGEVEAIDSKVDALHADLFSTLQDPAWAYGNETLVDLTLLSRYFERFADHAVSITRRVVTVTTGEPYVGVRLEDPR
ncbi:MAG: phosphate signaling complex protein PhoU [Actinomycetota bacterium]|nr:phosphate signaling complex protein PhoU [Actinomycetota bacterium]